MQTLKDKHPLSNSGCPWLYVEGLPFPLLRLRKCLVEEVPSHSILVPTHPLYRRISEPETLKHLRPNLCILKLRKPKSQERIEFTREVSGLILVGMTQRGKFQGVGGIVLGILAMIKLVLFFCYHLNSKMMIFVTSEISVWQQSTFSPSSAHTPYLCTKWKDAESPREFFVSF